VLVDVVADRHDQLLDIAEDPRRSWFLVRSRKNRSTIFDHELLVGYILASIAPFCARASETGLAGANCPLP
jgi:hypothetical protein